MCDLMVYVALSALPAIPLQGRGADGDGEWRRTATGKGGAQVNVIPMYCRRELGRLPPAERSPFIMPSYRLNGHKKKSHRDASVFLQETETKCNNFVVE